MDKQEFERWVARTKESEQEWLLDECMLANHGTRLYYQGGESGVFIEHRRGEPTASYGTYEYAIPHIGEAIFKIVGTANTWLKAAMTVSGLHPATV